MIQYNKIWFTIVIKHLSGCYQWGDKHETLQDAERVIKHCIPDKKTKKAAKILKHTETVEEI